MRGRRENTSAGAGPALVWIEAGRNPYGVRLLDCRPFTWTAKAKTPDPKAAERFLRLRASRGEQLRRRTPSDALEIACRLDYPLDGDLGDGPLFRAQELEDKWDVFRYGDQIDFARSWTGDLVHRARVQPAAGRLVLTAVSSDAAAVDGDGRLAVRQVDYLLKSHLFGRVTPHPLPAGFPAEPQAIALYSFGAYGRRCAFATFADTVAIDLDAGEAAGE